MATPMQSIQQALEQARLGRVRPAIAALERLTQKRGAPAEAWHFLGMLQAQSGEIERGIFNLERACQLAPGRAQFLGNLGNVLAGAGRSEEALARFEEALGADPGYGAARVGRAGVLLAVGRLAEAEEEAREAWRLLPGDAQAAANLGSCLIVSGRAGEAVAHLRGAIGALGPSVMLQTLLAAAMHYDSASEPGAVLDAHKTLGHLHAAAAREFAGGLPALKELDCSAGVVRVGLLSADFRDHPVGMFIEPVLRGSEGVEVYCYDCTASRDAASERMRGRGGVWRDAAGLDDAGLAAMVRGDGVDVLVELSGHSLGNRQTALAARMAPVQVSYLGYPATTGNPAVDARFVDGRSDPDGAGAHCTERLVRLGECAWCFSAPEVGPGVAALPCGESGAVTFGSFNNLSKTTPGVLDVWARVLGRVEGSRLVLKNGAFVDARVRARVAGELVARGVASGQVEMLPPTGDAAGHLEAYAGIDVALDTFPYAGTTTTCEALWMGVPVVTLAGGMHAGRVGVSVLGAVGLDELVAADVEGYVEVAARLAGDRARLGGLRAGLRARVEGSVLMDREGFAERFFGACVGLVRGEG